MFEVPVTPAPAPIHTLHFHVSPPSPIHGACRSRANHTGSIHKTTDFNGNDEGGWQEEGAEIRHHLYHPLQPSPGSPLMPPLPTLHSSLERGQDFGSPLSSTPAVRMWVVQAELESEMGWQRMRQQKVLLKPE